MFTPPSTHVLPGPLWRIGWRVGAVGACMGLTLVAACGVTVGDDIVDDAADVDVGGVVDRCVHGRRREREGDAHRLWR
ncbi:hypothetical protein LK459_04515 [Gordonia otitidis]|uniref:hypothetical protein n=1 Tax=Gordonia otitidis TaxID=249058 RepID=UPI001D154593|nr:hypothetical protein [Gordonia otitidis]UEA60143.1 hypothetical protein LK459_04515 [Gordonia otitidis]